MKQLSIVITQEDNMYVAQNPDTGVASQGKSVEEALKNIREAIELYLEETQQQPENHKVMLTTIEI